MKNGGSGVYIKYPDGDTTSLSVLGGFQCSNYKAEIPAICTAAEHLLERGKQMRTIAIFTDSLSNFPALDLADPDQMIQGLHFPLAKLTAQFSVFLQWVHAHVGLTENEKADRLAKFGSQAPQTQNLSPTEGPRHFSTPGSMETGKEKMVDTRHTLTQFGDWSGPSNHYLSPAHRALWSECTSEEDWHIRHFPVWVRTSWPNPRPRPSVLLKICQETPANMAAWSWSGDQAVGLGRRYLSDGCFMASTGLKIRPAQLSIAEEEEGRMALGPFRQSHCVPIWLDYKNKTYLVATNGTW